MTVAKFTSLFSLLLLVFQAAAQNPFANGADQLVIVAAYAPDYPKPNKTDAEHWMKNNWNTFVYQVKVDAVQQHILNKTTYEHLSTSDQNTINQAYSQYMAGINILQLAQNQVKASKKTGAPIQSYYEIPQQQFVKNTPLQGKAEVYMFMPMHEFNKIHDVLYRFY